MTTTPRLPRILALHPIVRGFGWVVFEGPLAPIDWGFSVTKGDKNLVCLQKVDALIEKFLPEVLALEAFEPRYVTRSERMTRLGRALTTLATARGIDAAVFGKHEVKACFRASGAFSRHEIAQTIAQAVPALQSQPLRKRRPWETMSPTSALFAAAALAMTHYYLSTNTLFDDLKGSKNPENPMESA